MKRSALPYLLVFVLVLLLVSPAMAQETSTPDSVILPDQIVKPAEVFGSIIGLMAMFAAGVGPLAQVVTSLYKFVTMRWFPDSASAHALPVVALIVPVVLTVVFWIADAFGLSDLYVVVANNLITAIPVLISILGAFAGQHIIYQRVWKPLDAPLTGKSSYQLRRKSKAYYDSLKDSERIASAFPGRG